MDSLWILSFNKHLKITQKQNPKSRILIPIQIKERNNSKHLEERKPQTAHVMEVAFHLMLMGLSVGPTAVTALVARSRCPSWWLSQLDWASDLIYLIDPSENWIKAPFDQSKVLIMIEPDLRIL